MKGYNPRYLKMRGAMQDIVVTQQDGEPVMRGRAFTNESNSPLQHANRTSFGGHNTSFKNLPAVTKNGWLLLAEQVHDPARKRPLSAANCFVMVNSALAAAKLPTVTDAPLTVDTPIAIVDVRLTTTTGPVHDPVLALQIHSDETWDGPILVMGYAPQLLGFNKYERREAVLLGVLPALPSGVTTVTGLFTSHFGIPEAGTKIALLLARVSPHGFKSPTTFIESPYVLTASAAGESGEDLHVA